MRIREEALSFLLIINTLVFNTNIKNIMSLVFNTNIKK